MKKRQTQKKKGAIFILMVILITSPMIGAARHDNEFSPGADENNQKFLRGGEKREAEKLGRWEDGKLRSELRIISRPTPGTNENQHKRLAQHIGPPRRGAPGRRWQNLSAVKDGLFKYPLATPLPLIHNSPGTPMGCKCPYLANT